MRTIFIKNTVIILAIYLLFVLMFCLFLEANNMIYFTMMFIRLLIILAVSFVLHRSHRVESRNEIKRFCIYLHLCLIFYLCLLFLNVPQKIYGVCSLLLGIYDIEFLPLVVLWEQIISSHLLITILVGGIVMCISMYIYSKSNNVKV